MNYQFQYRRPSAPNVHLHLQFDQNSPDVQPDVVPQRPAIFHRALSTGGAVYLSPTRQSPSFSPINRYYDSFRSNESSPSPRMRTRHGSMQSQPLRIHIGADKVIKIQDSPHSHSPILVRAFSEPRIDIGSPTMSVKVAPQCEMLLEGGDSEIELSINPEDHEEKRPMIAPRRSQLRVITSDEDRLKYGLSSTPPRQRHHQVPKRFFSVQPTQQQYYPESPQLSSRSKPIEIPMNVVQIRKPRPTVQETISNSSRDAGKKRFGKVFSSGLDIMPKSLPSKVITNDIGDKGVPPPPLDVVRTTKTAGDISKHRRKIHRIVLNDDDSSDVSGGSKLDAIGAGSGSISSESIEESEEEEFISNTLAYQRAQLNRMRQNIHLHTGHLSDLVLGNEKMSAQLDGDGCGDASMKRVNDKMISEMTERNRWLRAESALLMERLADLKRRKRAIQRTGHK